MQMELDVVDNGGKHSAQHLSNNRRVANGERRTHLISAGTSYMMKKNEGPRRARCNDLSLKSPAALHLTAWYRQRRTMSNKAGRLGRQSLAGLGGGLQGDEHGAKEGMGKKLRSLGRQKCPCMRLRWLHPCQVQYVPVAHTPYRTPFRNGCATSRLWTTERNHITAPAREVGGVSHMAPTRCLNLQNRSFCLNIAELKISMICRNQIHSLSPNFMAPTSRVSRCITLGTPVLRSLLW